jgi:hypothetical protein
MPDRLLLTTRRICQNAMPRYASSSTMLPCTIILRHDSCIHSTSPSSSSEQDGQFVTGSMRRAYLEREKEHPKESDGQNKYRSRVVRIVPIPLPDNSPPTIEVCTFYIALQVSGSLIPQFPVVFGAWLWSPPRLFLGLLCMLHEGDLRCSTLGGSCCRYPPH